MQMPDGCGVQMQVCVKRKRDSEDVYKRDFMLVDQRCGGPGALHCAVDLVV